MIHLDLFSGIGGFSLAASRVWSNHNIHSFVENDSFCIEVLKKHWPSIPIHNDVRTYKHDGTKIDILSAGFPCQPYSNAGSRRGGKDMWLEVVRIAIEARPDWIVCENVNGFINMGLVSLYSAMEKIGYSSKAFIIPAYSVGKKHKRNRIWIVSHANGNSEPGSTIYEKKRIEMGDKPTGMGRNVNGLPGRMDKRRRLKAIGNSIVPQIAETIFKTIKHTGIKAGQIHKKDVKK